METAQVHIQLQWSEAIAPHVQLINCGPQANLDPNLAWEIHRCYAGYIKTYRRQDGEVGTIGEAEAEGADNVRREPSRQGEDPPAWAGPEARNEAMGE